MSKKLKITAIFGVLLLVAGGYWGYQANRFEKSITHEVVNAQNALQKIGITFTYDALKVSKWCFEARLTNPKVFGKMPNLEGDLGALEGMQGTYTIKGDVVGTFSLLSNTLTLNFPGTGHIDVAGPIQCSFSTLEPKEFKVSIQRKGYDVLGKHSFFSFHNVKRISTLAKNYTLLLNGQKLFTAPDVKADCSFDDTQGNNIDVAFSCDYRGFQFFEVEKVLEGSMREIETFNTYIKHELSTYAFLGATNQKIDFSVHLNNTRDYIYTLIETLLKFSKNKFEKHTLDSSMLNVEKLFPKGSHMTLREFSTKNNVYESTLALKVEHNNDVYPVTLSGSFKVTDQWAEYWKRSFHTIAHSLKEYNLGEEFYPILENEAFINKTVPHWESLGNIAFTMNMDIMPNALSWLSGNANLNLKSELYDLNVTVNPNVETPSVMIKTRNGNDLIEAIKQYANRVSEPFMGAFPGAVDTVKNMSEAISVVLQKIMEPQGASEQSLEIKVTKEGIKIGKYEMLEILTLFNQSIPATKQADALKDGGVPKEGEVSKEKFEQKLPIIAEKN